MTAGTIRVGVVADDITGAGDIGSMFAKHGYAVRIFSADADLSQLASRLQSVRTDVAVVDTDSRFDPPAVAAGKVRRATVALSRWGCERFYKKTCSVFRGNVGAEFDATLDELGAHFGVVVAAFPKNGRVTRDGVHYVHGRLLAESQFARDPVHPRTESDLVRDLASQTARAVAGVPLAVVRAGSDAVSAALDGLRAQGVGYALCDAETQDDLAVLARAVAGERVVLGASALAEELPGVWPTPAAFDPLAGWPAHVHGGTLVLAGSVMPQTREQIEVIARAGIEVLSLDSRAIVYAPDDEISRVATRAAEVLRGGAAIAVRSDNSPEGVEATRALGAGVGLAPVDVSRRVSDALARIAGRAVTDAGTGRIVVLGGDTSASVCRRLGVSETVAVEELAPGLPITASAGARPILLVLKSGSFGGPEFVLRAIDRLEQIGRR